VGVSLPSGDIPLDEFTFPVNEKVFPTSAGEAVILSPAVAEQRQVDPCARRVDISAPAIASADFSSLQDLLSKKEVSLPTVHQKSLILLSRQLLNGDLERPCSGLCAAPPSTPL
jgi:hypothetical protein